MLRFAASHQKLATGVPVMTASAGAGIPLDVATRQMTITNFDLRAANGIEILGITTAIFLLALILCRILCTGLLTLWDLCCLQSGVSDMIPPIMKMPKKRDEVRRSTRKWSFISRLRTNHGEQEGSPYTPHSTSSASKTRVKIKPHATIKRNYYTQIPDRCKPPSRKPLPLPKAAISTTRRKDTTLDMEEGLGLSSNAAASFPNGDHFTHPSGTASCRESKSEKSIHNFDKSFLHCRTASL
ncbi:hypothetical protein F5B17DRAFT_64036 [Nemania serpens]|nr:hypothetical protein F5B17DRAFT_64036 [Nemania serpens]